MPVRLGMRNTSSGFFDNRPHLSPALSNSDSHSHRHLFFAPFSGIEQVQTLEKVHYIMVFAPAEADQDLLDRSFGDSKCLEKVQMLHLH